MIGIISGAEGVQQPLGGLLRLEFFDPVPISLSDGRVLSRENLPGDVVDGAVKVLSCLDALVRDTGFDVDDRLLLRRVEETVFEAVHQDMPDAAYAEAYAGGISARVGGFDHAAADCACKLAYCMQRRSAGYANPSRIRADDRTCTNILTMVGRMNAFLDVMGPVRRICFRFPGGYGKAVNSGFGMFLTDECLWDVTTSADPLPEKARLALLIRYVLSRGSKDPALTNIRNIGIMNPRLHCAYMMPAGDIPQDVLEYVAEGIVGIDSLRIPSGA